MFTNAGGDCTTVATLKEGCSRTWCGSCFEIANICQSFQYIYVYTFFFQCSGEVGMLMGHESTNKRLLMRLMPSRCAPPINWLPRGFC